MAKQPRKWVVKDKNGKIYGPFSTEAVLKQIERGLFSGGESIARFPGGSWEPISKDPQFYDKLLEVLEIEGGIGEKVKSPPSPIREVKQPEPEQKPSRGSVVEEKATPGESEADHGENLSEISPFEPKAVDKEQVIELTDVKKHIKKEVRKKRRFPLVFITLVIFGGIAFLFMIPPRTTSIKLIAPKFGSKQLPKKQLQQVFQKAIWEFQRDSFNHYLRAQNFLVQASEGSGKNVEILALLCLTYRGLWPYTKRDNQDRRVFSDVVRYAGKLDPVGLHGSTCSIAFKLVEGRITGARSLVETSLENYPTAAVLHVFRGEILAINRNYETAMAYIQKAQELWPKWVRPYALEAYYLKNLQRVPQARSVFKRALTINPRHPFSLVHLASIEWWHFRKPDAAYDLVQSAFNGSDRMDRKTNSLAHLILAELYLQRGDQEKAFQAAKKSYSLQKSGNNKAKEIIVHLQGIEALEEGSTQEMFVADEFFNSGNWLSAQAEYKTVFDSNPKNAYAAMRAGQCLWRLSQPDEAIDWMKKAIRADPKLIEAYVELADYHSHRYNFAAAGRVLNNATQMAKRDYRVYRGKAKLEFKRRNFEGSKRYAQSALKLYDTDIESYVIIAESYRNLQDYSNAFTFANRAIELDINNEEAQRVYTKVLAGYQGVEQALAYINNLITGYPTKQSYRMVKGEVLFEDERFGDAEELFSGLVEINRNNKKAWLYLGRSLVQQGQFKAAIKAFLSAAELDPTDAEALFEIGLLYLQAGDSSKAITQFQRVLRANKRYPKAHYYLGLSAFRGGKYDLALEEANLEKQVNPRLAEPYLLAGDVYAKQNKFSFCLSEYQKAIELRPQNSNIYIKMSSCYRLSGNVELAITMLNQAAAKESGNPAIYRELCMAYRAKSAIDEAIKSCRQYLVLMPNALDRAQIQKIIDKLNQQ